MYQRSGFYRRDIDGLRGLSILAVVLFHFNPTFLPGGFWGVDVFFVISGYLITGIILNDIDTASFHLRDFYVRRCRRIMPALALVLASCLLFGWFLLLADDYQKLGGDVVGGALFYSNLLLWKGAGYFSPDAQLNPLLHLWSLSVEEQFYVLWPITLVLIRKKNIPLIRFIVFVLGLSFVLHVLLAASDSTAAFYLLPTRLWELMVGGLLVAVERSSFADIGLAGGYIQRVRRLHLPWIRECVSVLGIILIVSAFLNAGLAESMLAWWALLPTLGSAMIIGAGASTLLSRYVLGNPCSVFLGLISYPLYLWHWPLLVFIKITYADAPAFYAFCAVAVAVLLSVMTYCAVEKPLRSQRGLAQRQMSVFILLGLMCLIVMGGLAVQRDGFKNRFSMATQYLTNYAYNHSEAYRSGQCFIEEAQQNISPLCVDEGFGDPQYTSVFLWGDSEGAHLYPGLKAFQSVHPALKLAQFTRYKCPAYVDYINAENPDVACRDFTRAMLGIIHDSHPDIVILASRWGQYKVPSMMDALTRTVGALREIGVKKILLFGPAPVWNHHLSHSLYTFFRQDILHRVPERMTFDLSYRSELGPSLDGVPDNMSIIGFSVQSVDDQLRIDAERLSITYISSYHALCNEEGCLTNVGHNPDDLISWDRHHFTARGSEFLIQSIPEAIFLK